MLLLLTQLLYVIPSVLLYLATIIIITSLWTNLNSSFFHFYIFDFTVNTFTLLNTFFVLRLPTNTCEEDCFLSPIFKNLDTYINSSPFYAAQYHMAYVQYSSTLIASINRFTVIRDFSYFEYFWKRYSTLFMLLILFLPIPHSIWVMSFGTEWQFQKEQTRYILHSTVPLSTVSYVILPFLIVTTLIALVLNSVSIVKVSRIGSQRRKLVETNFLKLTVITCFIQVLGTIQTMIITLAPRPSIFYPTIMYIVPFASDMLTLCHPWLLVWLSKPIRDSILGLFTPSPTSSQVSSVLVQNFNR